MNFLHPLPWLILPVALAASQGPIQGGGTLTLGHTAYRFMPKDLAAAGPKEGLPGALRIRGELIPETGGPVYTLELVVLRNGRLYLLNLRHGTRGQYPDTWAATLSTRVRILALEDHPGGRVELACEGRLTGVVDRRPVSGSWQGHLWAIFPEPEGED
ncbi:MAG TPA: hypothetical protein VF804_02940 [Holophagaceae bacterium]